MKSAAELSTPASVTELSGATTPFAVSVVVATVMALVAVLLTAVALATELVTSRREFVTSSPTVTSTPPRVTLPADVAEVVMSGTDVLSTVPSMFGVARFVTCM